MRSALWRNADFLRFWSAQATSELGSQISLVALPLTAILVLDASAFEVALLAAFEFAPFLLLGLPAGVVVDRVPRRHLLVLTDVCRGLLLVSIPAAYAVDRLTLPQLLVVGFATGSCTVFFSLAYTAYLPSLLPPEQLIDGNAKLEATRSIAQTAGPAAGGGLVALISAPVAVLADAVSFFASALLLGTIRKPESQPPRVSTRRDFWRELREGVSFLVRNRYLRAGTIAGGIANFSWGLVWAVVLVYATRTLGLNAAVIGALLSVGQAGGILTSAAATPRLTRAFGVGPTLIGAAMLIGPGYLLVGAASGRATMPLFAAGWMVSSFASLTYAVVGGSVGQTVVPSHLRGRVFGAFRFVLRGVIPLGALTGGVLAATIGLRAAVIVGASVALATFVPLLASPFRSLSELPSVEIEVPRRLAEEG
jgi:MFS family permease